MIYSSCNIDKHLCFAYTVRSKFDERLFIIGVAVHTLYIGNADVLSKWEQKLLPQPQDDRGIWRSLSFPRRSEGDIMFDFVVSV